MEVYKNGNEVIWYDPELLSEPVGLCTNAPYWYIRNKVIGSAKGRGTTWFVQLDKLQGALRHYRRGGLFGKLVRDQYRFEGWEKTRSYQEFVLLRHLKEAGVNVPVPIAARAYRKGLTYQADLLSEKITDASDLVSILQKGPIATMMYEKIGAEIRKMHDAQVNHTDLNIHNILIDVDENIWIIDFDKCAIEDGGIWKEKNIERLHRSFVKEQGKRGINWSSEEFDALRSGYNNNGMNK